MAANNSGESTTSWISRLGAGLIGGVAAWWVSSSFLNSGIFNDPGEHNTFWDTLMKPVSWLISTTAAIGGAVLAMNWWTRGGENSTAQGAQSFKDWIASWFKSGETSPPPASRTDVRVENERPGTTVYDASFDEVQPPALPRDATRREEIAI